jgi:hypothetical protein
MLCLNMQTKAYEMKIYNKGQSTTQKDKHSDRANKKHVCLLVLMPI